MKNENGITLVSLIVYILVMTFVLAAISSITASFHSSINDYDKDSESTVAYAKFNMYFLKDIKRKDAKVYASSDDYVIISYKISDDVVDENTGTITQGDTELVEYLVENGSLYRDKVKICDDVEYVQFIGNSEKNTISVDMKIGDYSKNTTYVLENINNTKKDNLVYE